MQMTTEKLEHDAVKIVLIGRLDIAGSEQIALTFDAVTGSERFVIVDMSGVDFLASIGIRSLLGGAKTVQRRGGRFVLLAPQPEVGKVLEVSGMLDLMQVAQTEQEALQFAPSA